ncbi:Histidine--tRNA ligase [Candidatus Kinetoplastibacterium sorsogonicusi]|uniref:Histidine--tRNA ligase n=1 Tax=Candidatus Kinetoplastidibacterium kentomonadis TaxID=1576550 RepID=A0A3S7J9Z4_9PROT|nr:histidine--tRNA ligase [Candidatus Kinetoplastibacterium sorsogonicusi]AWD32493.1 Histidine--tRNA ligase [Candidatus Kinetoplastibacterium sorsogonicusi]
MTKDNKIFAVRGMNDVIPKDSFNWNKLETLIQEWLSNYGYLNIKIPILEYTDLFVRGIGEITDIVEKEMYSFNDGINGPSLTMRPEITAGIVRSVIENNLLYDGPKRLYSLGPVFRHERPQSGRYRQFHQIDVEAFGFAGPDIDFEIISMLSHFWQKLEILEYVQLEINSLGDIQERKLHKDALISYFRKYLEYLDQDSKRRLELNPLRILDSKNNNMQEIINNAPKLIDFLGYESKKHFDLLCNFLEKTKVKYLVNHRLVRGLDYYNNTVFEWISDDLGAKSTFCGGGRYDKLIENLGGKSTPAIGFAIGFERLLYIYNKLHKSNINKHELKQCDIYIVYSSTEAYIYGYNIANKLRQLGKSVILHAGNNNFKQQFKKADLSGAIWALIIGEQELLEKTISIKCLRAEHKTNKLEQIKISYEEIINFFTYNQNI